jgi:hypothetical protein
MLASIRKEVYPPAGLIYLPPKQANQKIEVSFVKKMGSTQINLLLPLR